MGPQPEWLLRLRLRLLLHLIKMVHPCSRRSNKQRVSSLFQDGLQGLHHDIRDEGIAFRVRMEEVGKCVFGIAGYAFKKERYEGQTIFLREATEDLFERSHV